MRRFTRAFLHSHALFQRGSPLSLSFKSLTCTPEAADVGACTPNVSTGALETRNTNVRKARKLKAEKITCGSPHADASTSPVERSRPAIKSKPKTNVARAKVAKRSNSEDAHVHENAATQISMPFLHSQAAFKEEKPLPNPAVDRSDEIAINAVEGANDGMSHAKRELSEWAAKLDLNSSTRGRKWTETAYKLLDYGISSAHVKRMLQQCRRLPCLDSSDSILEHFAMLGMSHEEMGRVISRWPTILNLSNLFQSRVEFFESVGIDRCSLGKIMHDAYRVMGLSPRVLRQRYEFWNNYFQDVEENAFHTLVSRNPRILAWNLQKVKLNLAYLKDIGLSFDKKVLLRGSALLSYNVETLSLKLKLLKEFGALNRRNLTCNLVKIKLLSIVKLHERLHNLFASGFSSDQVKKMMAVCPQVLGYTEDRTNLRLSYAVNVLNLSLDAVVECSPFWSRSFEKRIKYRYEVLQKLTTLGIHVKDYSLRYLISMSDAKFSMKFLEKLPADTLYSSVSK